MYMAMRGLKITNKINNFGIAARDDDVITMTNMLKEDSTIVNQKEIWSGNTALHMASAKGSINAVKVLIENQADVNAQNESGCTPLHRASEGGHIQTIQFLLEHGADVSVKNKVNSLVPEENKSAYDVAHKFESRRVIKEFQDNPVACSSSGIPIISNGLVVDITARIGSTASSNVYRGTFRGANVAIKIIRGDGDLENSVGNLQQPEIELLSSLRHPRILTLMGVVLDLDPRYGAKCGLVTEYMTRGSLYSVLHKADAPPKHTLTSLLSKLRVLSDVAEGMRFLHGSNVIHRDLKSLNVLLDEEGRAKICDFGVSKLLSADMTHASTAGIGTPAWSSPEALLGNVGGLQFSSDVYSFGVILWEMLTNSVPWSEINPWQIPVHLSRGESLPIPITSDETAPQPLINLLKRCLDHHPEKRPDFSFIFDYLHEQLSQYLDQQQVRDPKLPRDCPDEYICPISREVMVDPVVCSDGYTYERVNIELWLSNHNRSPMTNVDLTDKSLCPNIALRVLIQNYNSA